jgi:hypothetical protein
VKGLIVLHQTTVQYRTDSSEHHGPGPHSDPRRPTSFPTSPPKTVPHQKTGLFIFKSSYVVVQLVSCVRARMTPLPLFHLSRTMLSFDGLVTMGYGAMGSYSVHRSCTGCANKRHWLLRSSEPCSNTMFQNPPVAPNNPRLFDDRTVRKQTSYPKRSHPSHGSSSLSFKFRSPLQQYCSSCSLDKSEPQILTMFYGFPYYCFYACKCTVRVDTLRSGLSPYSIMAIA